MTPGQSERVNGIIAAFQAEQPHPFQVRPGEDVFHFNGRIGVRASNHSACFEDGRLKWAYYLEGTPYEMGYLLGLMAEPEIRRMCSEFNDRVVLEFIDIKFRNRKLERLIGETLQFLLYWLCGNIYPDIPAQYKREIEGMLDGCRAANPSTSVTWQELWVLNVGVDAMLSYVYTGSLPIKKELPFKITPRVLTVPIQCNGFAVFGEAVQDNGHLMGRDFMFPTAGVFQDTACLIVQNPQDRAPFVSMTAPGIVGCIAGMNVHGIGVGVDMCPSGNCNPARPGLNSLLLARHSIENSQSCDQAIQVMEEAQRGVSWNYILADYHGQKACVVEAGCTVEDQDAAAQVSRQIQEALSDPTYEYLPGQLAQSLPQEALYSALALPEFRRGLMVRWSDYAYPEGYLAHNARLFKLFGKKHDPQDFAESGYIDRTWTDRNCPYAYYFAPQREGDANLVLVTNMYIIPEMRLYAMHPWSNLIASSHYDDMQWRYDELNRRLLTKMRSEPGYQMTLEDAKELINYLAPSGDYPDYYNPKPKANWWQRLLGRIPGSARLGIERDSPRPDWRQVQVKGSVSVLDLKERSMHSLYGYYGDDWVKVTLPAYLTSG